MGFSIMGAHARTALPKSTPMIEPVNSISTPVVWSEYSHQPSFPRCGCTWWRIWWRLELPSSRRSSMRTVILQIIEPEFFYFVLVCFRTWWGHLI